MRMSFVSRSGVAVLASLSLLLLSGAGLLGQAAPQRTFEIGMRTGVGYTGAIPDAAVGVGVWHLFGSGRFGVFADAKTTFPSKRDNGDYCPEELTSCTVPDIEAERIDIVLRDVDEYLLFNLGGLITVSPEIAFLLGAGPVRHSRIREYFDGATGADYLITDDGSYYAPHVPASSWTAQFVVGTLIRLGNRLVVRFGYERGPGGISFGGYWVFSR